MADSDEEILSHTLQTFVENLKNEIKKGLVIVEGTVATGSVDMLAYTCTVNIKTNTLALNVVAPAGQPQKDQSTKLVADKVSFTNVPLETLINSLASFIIIPNDVSGSESIVLMSFRDGSFQRPQLIKTHNAKEIILTVGNSKLDITPNKIVFNGGNNGLPLSDKLKAKLNNLENLVNDLIVKFNTHVHPVPGVTVGSGATTSSVTTTTETNTLTPTVQNDIQSAVILQQ